MRGKKHGRSARGGKCSLGNVDKENQWSRIPASACHEVGMVLPIYLLFEQSLPIVPVLSAKA